MSNRYDGRYNEDTQDFFFKVIEVLKPLSFQNFTTVSIYNFENCIQSSLRNKVSFELPFFKFCLALISFITKVSWLKGWRNYRVTYQRTLILARRNVKQ